jgi:hypothetical protein
LCNKAALAVHFELQLARIESDEWLAFADIVANIGEDVRYAAFHFRTEDAFFKRVERAHCLDAAPGGFFGDGVEVHGRGVRGVSKDTGGLSLGAPGGKQYGQRHKGSGAGKASPKIEISV